MLAFRPEGGSVTSGLELGKARPATASQSMRVSPAASPAAVDWADLVSKLQVAGAARELARNAELMRREGSAFELVVPKSKGYLAEKSYQDKLKAALEQHLGVGVTLKVVAAETRGNSVAAMEAIERDKRHAEATRSVQKDRFVQDLVEICDAKVIDSTIQATPRQS
ncbi:MAG: DNA polymerase III subunit gamma/tau C-terminal domain-containing protein [Burkholderiales bacterium]